MYKRYSKHEFSKADNKASTVGVHLLRASSSKSGKHTPLNSDEGIPKLHLAVLQSGDHDCLVGHVIKEGADVNAKDRTGHSALHIAARNGYLGCTQRLIQNGAEVDSVNDTGQTPLMEAARQNHLGVVEYLVRSGAKVNMQNECKESVLHYAVLNRDGSETVKFIIQSGAIINIKDVNGVTPLFVAVKLQIIPTVQLLLKEGCDPNMTDFMGFTPLQHAASLPDGDPAVVKALLAGGAGIDDAKKDGEAPFILAIRNKNHRILKVLLNAGCDVTNMDGLNGTALALATLCGHLPSVQLLLDYGEDPDELAYYGMSPLTCAAYQSNVRMVELLLNYGADPNVKSRVGHTALFATVKKTTQENEAPRHEVLKLLLRAGGDVNQRVATGIMYTTCTQGRNCVLSFSLGSGYLSYIRMCLLAGMKGLSPEELHQWGKAACNSRQKSNNTQFHMYFNPCPIFMTVKDWVSNAQSLKQICRTNIRDILKDRVIPSIPKLPVPESVKKFLNFEEFDHIVPERSENSVMYQIDERSVVTACGLIAIEREFGFIVQS